ncbi:MAG: hypothetical protein OET63_02340 [Desulfobacterales bacterium]|jgi:hypothetical protein|nr:hypothetical protein [Desulfobacterales bacterium]
MDSDQNNSQLPVKSDSKPAQARNRSEIQGAPGFLPRTDSIQMDEKIAIAQDEGFNPLAIELAMGSHKTPAAYKLLLFGLVTIAAVLVAFLFPIDRFFKPKTEDLGTMTIGEPISEDNKTLFTEFNKPWLKVLLEMDRLYFREGKLTEAIQVAESNLARVPETNWESWKKVHYRYWELLSDAGRTLPLKAGTGAYLHTFPEDPFANYYSAYAFLAAVDQIRSFNRKTHQAYRLEAERLIQQIDNACNALKARQKMGSTKEKTRYLLDLYQKLRLQQARLYVLIWRLGGYREDNHPDVVYRDKALNIVDRKALVNLKEAKALKITIYNHILDRWHWFEGQQIIQSKKQKRRALVEELRALQKELKDAETL